MTINNRSEMSHTNKRWDVHGEVSVPVQHEEAERGRWPPGNHQM
jgi:hypothetical protein